jgi:hypothetical protein
MTTEKPDLKPVNFARFNAENAWGLIATGYDEPRPSHEESLSDDHVILRYISKTDRTYISHDLPEPVVRDIFTLGTDRRGAQSAFDWEGIAIGVFLTGYLVLGSAVIFKVAAFGSLFTS